MGVSSRPSPPAPSSAAGRTWGPAEVDAHRSLSGAAAEDLAMQQAACLTAEGSCAAASVQALMAPSEAAPAAATPEA